MSALSSRLLWGVSITAVILAGTVFWKVFLSPALIPEDLATNVATVKPRSGENPRNTTSTAETASPAATPISKPTSNSPSSKPAAIALSEPKPLPTVRLPISPTVSDKEKLREEAFSIANTLVAKRPSDARAIHVAAVCNSQLTQTVEAQRLWEKCIELEPRTENFYLNLAANALFRGDTEYALGVTEKALANGLTSSNMSHHQALALARLGEDERAVEVCREAIDNNAASPGHWLLLGQSLLRLGQHEDAKKTLEEAIQQGVDNRALYVALMNACVRLKLTEEAVKYRDKVDAMGDDAPADGNQSFAEMSEREARNALIAVLAEASSVYREAGMFEDGEMLGLRLLAIEPNNYGICRFLADLYRDTKRKADEIVVRERMLQLAPNDLMNVLQLARCYADTNQPEQTQATLKLAISTTPNEAIGYAAMAEFLLERREPAKAQWYAEQAVSREASPAGYRLLAAILRSQGKESEAQKVEANATAAAVKTVQPQPPNSAVNDSPLNSPGVNNMNNSKAAPAPPKQ